MTLRALIGGAAIAALLTAPVVAQPVAPTPVIPMGFSLVKIPRPAEAPPELPLYRGAAPGSDGAEQAEAWGMRPPGVPVVRNVTRPTYSVFRPASGKANGAAVILAPGGAFLSLAMETEGWAAARWLAERGVTAFVLKYRLKETPANEADFMIEMGKIFGSAARSGPPTVSGAYAPAVADGQAMVRLLRAHAKDYGVDPKRIGFVGFSAGAITALSVTLAEDAAARPDFIAPIYPPMNAVTPPPDAPPMFVALARDDGLFGGKGFGLVESWQAARAPVELHYYDAGAHGFGMRKTGTTSEHWIEEFYWWMDARGLFKAAKP